MLIGNNRKKLQFITLLTAIMLCFTHRKQQKRQRLYYL